MEVSSNPTIVAIKVGNKKAINDHKTKYEYFFGNKYDKDQNWNNGKIFSYKDWEKYSADIWDNIAIVSLNKELESNKKIKLQHIAIRKGSQLVLDTRKRKTFLTNKKINIKFRNEYFKKVDSKYKVINISNYMNDFRKNYYEIKGDLLRKAIDDLGQSGSKKYSIISKNWCSEFIAYVYGQYQIGLPDPNKTDIHFEVLRPYFKKYGNVYTFYEVSKWSFEKKKKLIPEGSYASFHINNKSQHSALVVKWFKKKDDTVLPFAAISGNNRKVVYYHKQINIKNNFFQYRKKEKKYFDNRNFFGVIDK